VARRLVSLAFLASVALSGGCADESFDLPAGASCHRSIQCGPGLACVLGVCSDDPTQIGGTVPENPNGPGGGAMDGEVPVPTPAIDAGDEPAPPEEPMDAGAAEMPEVDGG
jgi:hypothetical protein